MTEEVVDTGQRDRAITTFALIVGFCVWIQVLGTSAWAEVQLEDGRVFAVFLDLLPLVVLVVGASIRSRFALLTAFMLALVPGVIYAPETAISQLYNDMGLVRIAGTVGLYVVGLTISFAKRDAPTVSSENPSPRSTHERVIWLRTGLAFLLLFGVFQALYFDPIVSQTIAQTYENPDVATVFISMAVFFMWVIGVYMFVVVPSLNYEHDKRVLFKKFEFWAEFPNGRFLRRNAFELGVLGTFGILLVL